MYLRPFFELGATSIDFGDIAEKDAGALGLEVDSFRETFRGTRLALELGGEVEVNTVLLQPYEVIGICF